MMETTVKLSFSAVGNQTGSPYNGDFVVKTNITRREAFVADERRRLLLGPNATNVPASVNGEAYMFGQLSVRIVDGPDWWKNSDSGLDLQDENIAPELFTLVMQKEEERQKDVKAKADKAVKELSKKELKATKE